MTHRLISQKKKKKGRHWFEIFEHNLLKYLSLKTVQHFAILKLKNGKIKLIRDVNDYTLHGRKVSQILSKEVIFSNVKVRVLVAQPCLVLCDPVDCRLPGSSGHLQARIWQFSRHEYCNGLPFPSPGDLLNPGIKLGLLHCRQILYHLSHRRSPFINIKVNKNNNPQGEC